MQSTFRKSPTLREEHRGRGLPRCLGGQERVVDQGEAEQQRELGGQRRGRLSQTWQCMQFKTLFR